MSYNIDTWKTKVIEGFHIPEDSLFKNERKDFHPDNKKVYGNIVIYTFGEIAYVAGIIRVIREKKIIQVEGISCVGEGSGLFFHETLEPAFEDSYGKLVFICVWEEGNSITKTTVLGRNENGGC